MKNDYLLVLGASIMDIFGFSTSNYRAYNSTPGKIKMSFGGVCRNIAENSARIGINTKFLSVLGDDECGKSILEHSREIGYNMEDSMIIKGASTPTYLAILDENGEMVSAISDMKSLNAMTEEFIDSKKELIKNAKYVVVDSDNPKILSYILKNFSKETNFILDPVSAEKATWVKDMIKDFHTIKPNRHEAEILAGFPIKDTEDLIRASNYFLSLGIKKVYISLDSEGIFYNNGKQCGKVKALDVIVKNVTGAGDSFVAGIGHGYMNKLDEVDIVKFSMAMSIITIADEATIHPEMCLNKVLEEIDKIKWIEETYNV
ncbi:carbohydrate kinase family protein [Sarcina ventriculi]|uniref:Pseudouridine kinase n=1 Tax=Sarcina ventriculi TaxID=1267 RepID=A0ABP2AMZ5_SARVE|nr:carbohydrate kinase family protein [Sarcina ventriculi]MDO4402468.1 carbohydrate kinase family protein [Clostridiaceae bacterium]MBU5322157.1 carbohydrate kinase family protein [Sarcina ventriculi]MCI5637459.1 carbohydrate kinase family protein [Sarcina ventriculi]MDD7373938.1 carbohydrate kinase family protein [Sarcina ventriculi]CUN61175.1 Pseudouridine kinase [Sarcina ventriculi]